MDIRTNRDRIKRQVYPVLIQQISLNLNFRESQKTLDMEDDFRTFKRYFKNSECVKNEYDDRTYVY